VVNNRKEIKCLVGTTKKEGIKIKTIRPLETGAFTSKHGFDLLEVIKSLLKGGTNER
jgi:hypothetical protein